MTTPPLPSLSSEMPFNLDPNLTPLSEAFHKARSFQHKKYQQLKEQNELKKHLVVNLLHSVLSLTQGQIYPPLSLNSWTLNEPSITFQCFGNEPQTTSTSTSTSNLPPLNYSMVASKWIHVPDTDLPFPFHVLQVTVLDSPPLGITAVVHLKNTSTETLRNVYVSPLFSSVPITTLSTNRHCKELRPSTSIHLSCFIQVPWTYPSHSLQVHLMLHWNDTQHCSLGGHGVQQTLLTPCWIEYPISLPLNVQCKNSLPEVFHQLMAPEFAFSVLALSTLKDELVAVSTQLHASIKLSYLPSPSSASTVSSNLRSLSIQLNTFTDKSMVTLLHHLHQKASLFSSVSLGMDTTPPPLPDSILSLLEGNTKHWNVETLLDLYLSLSEWIS